jgi:hypothetical protein
LPIAHVPPTPIIPDKVWQAYVDDDFDQPHPFIFTDDPGYTNASLDPETFDVRDLDVPSVYVLLFGHPPTVDAETARAHGLPLRTFQKTPIYLEAVSAWSTWFDTTQPALIQAALGEWILITNP